MQCYRRIGTCQSALGSFQPHHPRITNTTCRRTGSTTSTSTTTAKIQHILEPVAATATRHGHFARLEPLSEGTHFPSPIGKTVPIAPRRESPLPAVA